MQTYSIKAFFGLLALSFCSFVSAQALWNGGGGADTRWSTGENWLGGTPPTPPNAGENIRFQNSAIGNTARYDMVFTTIPSISVEKCGFNAVTDSGNVSTVTVQDISGSCNDVGANLQSLLEMRLTLGANASINALTTDAGNSNTRRFIVRQPGGMGISAGANLVLNSNSSLGATGAQSILDVTLAMGNGIVKTGNGRVDFLNANTYDGETTISTGVLNAGNAQALGASGPTDFTTVRSVGTLAISTAAAIGETIRLEDNSDVAGENPILAGGGVVNHSVSAAVVIAGVAAEPTGIFVSNGTELRLLGGISAAAPATTRIEYLAKAPASTIVLGGPTNHGSITRIGPNATLRLDGPANANNRLSDISIIDISFGGTLNLNQNSTSTETIGGLMGTGDVVLGNMALTLNSEIDTSFSGSLFGGNVIKNGFNTFTAVDIFNPSSLNINAGEFVMQSDSTAFVVIGGGEFETTGTRAVRRLTMLNAPLGVLDIGGAIVRTLTVLPTAVEPQGIAVFGGTLQFDLSAGASDQLVLSNANGVGGVSLSGGTLAFTGNLPVNAQTLILDNQRPSGNLISGTFAAPFNNASGTAMINGNTYSYTYLGGDGNDFEIRNLGVPVVITTTTLPDANVNVAYSNTVAVSGGTSPYSYAITVGALPPGMSLMSNGVLSGTPSTAATFNFVVEVTDSTTPMPQRDTQALALRVLGTDFTWTGAGSTPNWNDPMNWNPSVVPPPGSALIFPLGVSNKTASNNLSFATAMRSIRVQDTGYLINGVNLTLTDAVPLRYEPPALAGAPTLMSLPLNLSAANPRIVVATQGGAFQPQLLDIATPTSLLSYTGELRVEIVCASCTAEADIGLKLSSPAGSSLSVFAPNGGVVVSTATHDGITRIEAGTLVANTASALGSVTGSASDGTEIWRGAQLIIAPTITAEHLSFNNLGTGNPPKLVPIASSQTFAGPILVENDFRIEGTPAPFFQITSDMIGGGNIQIVPQSTPLRRASSLERALGGPTGVSFSGTSVSRTGGLSADANAVLQLDSVNKFPATTNIVLPAFSRLVVNAAQTIAGLTGSGALEFGNATLTLSHDDTKTFAGLVGGVNGVLAFSSSGGTGRLRVTSLAPLNSASYRVDSGTLDLEGNSSTGAVRIGNGILAGNGATTGAVESLPGATGKIAPMMGDLGTGNLNIGASLAYEAIANGAAAGDHSELQVTGTVTIGASAALNVLSTIPLMIGTAITIVNNDGTADPVVGVFAGLPNGAIVTDNFGQTYEISYVGGDGNDVTLTRQAAGLIDVMITNISVTEGLSGTTTANIEFTRSASGSTFTVNGILTSGTADIADYVAGAVVANFSATGPNIVNVPIQINGDFIVEGAETLSVVVASAPSGVNPITSGVVTIINDDSSSIAFNASSALEGNGGGTGPAPLMVSLSNPIQGLVSFNMASTGGTATSGLDYTPFSQTLSLTSLQIQANPTLDVVRDAIVEADESVTFTLSGLVLPSGISPADVTLVAASTEHLIQNDDSAIISVSPFSQNEGNVGNTPFTVGLTLSAPVQGAVTVRLTPTQLAGDNATPLTDFSTTPVIANFAAAPGASTATVTLQVTGDTNVEPDETFSSVLDQITTVGGISPSAFTLGPVNKVTIVNDDLNAATTTTLALNPSPSAAGQAYAATAIVRNVGPTFPTGTVVISTVPSSSETCTTPALALLTSDSSTASCQITSALPGVRTFVATYVPTGAFTASTSANVPHVVRGEMGNLQISSNLPAGVVTGQPYTITVGLVPTLAGAPAPTGNVAIQHFPSPQMDSGAMVGGTVSIPTFSSTAVIKTLFVSYTDPTGVYPNRSSAFAQVVNKADVTLTGLNSTPQPSTVGQPVTASFVLGVVAPGAGTPTGTVTVTDGVDQCIATLPATSCVITLRTAGNRTLTYRYDGSIDYNAGLATRSHSVGNSANGSDVEITVSNGVTVVPQDRFVQYAVRSRLLAGDAASNVRVQAAVPAGIVSQIWSCVAENGATCPPNSTNVNGAIDAIVTLPQAGSALFVVSALTQATEGRVQFNATASVAAPVVDPNQQNNSATDNDVISNTAAESGFEDE